MMQILSIFLLLLQSALAFSQTLPLHKLSLPQGFAIKLYADPLPNAREMALGSKGTVFVGSRNAGKVYAIVKQGDATRILVIASGLNQPNGVAFRQGSLYVAEIHRILRFDQIEEHLEHPPKPVILNVNLPTTTHHGWRFIRFGPDDRLYIGIGAPCNVCTTQDPRFATISRMRPDGSSFEVYAKGIRNSVGFDWDPITKELWFTDNGRDWLGDNLPPDELNHAPRQNMDFGFPYYHGKDIPDPLYGGLRSVDEFAPPARELGPHVAALGMSFYTGKMFPAIYQNQIIISEHGSWNRLRKIGYRLTLVTIKNNQAISYQPFITGWLQGEKAWGRPVATLVMPDGSLLVSDDYAGVIYQITYHAN